MFIAKQHNIAEKNVAETTCYHCGTGCFTNSYAIGNKSFCCEGCKLVYEIINSNGLCDYYTIQDHPGLSQIKPLRKEKYNYLDEQSIAKQLYSFTDGKQAVVTLYIPGIHCVSCMWLLEHMQKLHNGIVESRLNYAAKEVTIRFLPASISIRKLVELLATIGYEPYISLNDTDGKGIERVGKSRIYKLGVAGFCFGNFMMMSFPEYLSGDGGLEHKYAMLFRLLNLLLSLPVFFYAASEFFVTAWKGIKQKTLNIDAPIALAILITFTRSVYEIATNTGSGYLDSMSGIVFFMLVGRIAQERTYKSISFHRDYKSYFPIAVNVVSDAGIKSTKLVDIKTGDIVQLYYDEIIPADSIVMKGPALVDYSFVTGETEPVSIGEGETVYAGGKQVGGQLVIQVIKPVAGSYLTSLWNHHVFSKDKKIVNSRESRIHTLSKYFTITLFVLAILTGLYWAVNDPAKILPAVSAMLIVACPCALLLSATYTNGNILRIFSNNGLYLRDATVIEQIGKIDEIVFDKTGTLTQGNEHFITSGHQLSDHEKDIVYAVTQCSSHPYSTGISSFLGRRNTLPVINWKEVPGEGIEGIVDGHTVRIGSAPFTGVETDGTNDANVYVRIDDNVTGFIAIPLFRPATQEVVSRLQEHYKLSLLSGDNDKQRSILQTIFGENEGMFFGQKPEDKLKFIESLQSSGKHVAMIGDGLNDAGALQQSNTGITLASDVNNFTPSCDAILDAEKFRFLPSLFKLAKSSATIVNISFAISIAYNVLGLSIAMQGKMNPMIAAILMPVSTLSIVLISFGLSSLWARKLGLAISEN